MKLQKSPARLYRNRATIEKYSVTPNKAGISKMAKKGAQQ